MHRNIREFTMFLCNYCSADSSVSFFQHKTPGEKNNVKNKAEVNLRALEKSIISDEEKGNYTDTCKYKVTSLEYRLRRAHKYWSQGNYGAANCNKRIENYK